MNENIFHGDAYDILKTIPDNSIDGIITDPPYGYSFMGKDWDKAIVESKIWRQCLRVLKPGSFACIMTAPRQDVKYRVIQNLEKSGFVVSFTPMFWAYASGFPKAMNVSKMIDKKLKVYDKREKTGEFQT